MGIDESTETKADVGVLRVGEPVDSSRNIFDRFQTDLWPIFAHRRDVITATLGPTVVLDNRRSQLFLDNRREIIEFGGNDESLYEGLLYCIEVDAKTFTWAKAHDLNPELIASVGHDLHDPATHVGAMRALAAGVLDKGLWEEEETPLVFINSLDEVEICRQYDFLPKKSLTTALTFDPEFTLRLIQLGVNPYDPRLQDLVFEKIIRKEEQKVIQKALRPITPRRLTQAEQHEFDARLGALLNICKLNALYTKSIFSTEVSKDTIKYFGSQLYVVPGVLVEPEDPTQFSAVLVPDEHEADRMKKNIRVKEGANKVDFLNDQEIKFYGSHKAGSLGWIEFVTSGNELQVKEIQTNLPHMRLHKGERYKDWGKTLLDFVELYARENKITRLTIPIPHSLLVKLIPGVPGIEIRKNLNRKAMVGIYARLPYRNNYKLVYQDGNMYWEKIL